ncbi:MAG: zinc-dependent peptidase [Bdellovibrio bacteriovorus]
MGPLGRWWHARRHGRDPVRYRTSDWAAAWDTLPLLDGLSADQAARLRDLALRFLSTKRLEPVQGLELTAPMRLSLALQACLPILELGLDWYRGWYAVILYPAEFLTEHEQMDEHGLVWTQSEVRSGESWDQGPVILSWADVEGGRERDGYNVVIHELAHKLDLRDGAANGRPPLHPGMSGAHWTRVFAAAFEDLCRRYEGGEVTAIDPYACESPAEFFAVVSEAFFEVPELLDGEYPEVYQQLRAFYRQDPLGRLRPGA